jgi:uncharacterized protein (TIGR03083 family)
MPTELRLDQHVAAITAACDLLVQAARRAGLDAPVPTCPAWDVRQLVTHQGMVHRWAAANLRGERDHRTADSTAEAAASSDLIGWLAEGANALVDTIRTTPDDAEAMVFLNDAPPPRRFWARRQAHETTIHSVDAVAAVLGRWPATADLSIPTELAADGIDELLCGFITRGKGKLAATEPYSITVATDDSGHAWTLHVGEASLETTPGAMGTPDATLRGAAVQLYTGLWNRTDEITADGRADVLTEWRQQVQVRWR